ncbi:ABC transporter permease subunit [Candidatus Daviesbacteria bacterium]|nr:ABC transporter permease subunit [Candidatus Daviesbacteria bacterium]
MRYTHSFKLIRKRRHAAKISIIITVVLSLLIILLGFKVLDAKLFFFGFIESLFRVVIAYGISLVIACLLAMLVVSTKKVEDITLPILDALQSFPSFALYPLFVLWFGKVSLVTIIILIVEMIWPILFTLLSSHKQIHQDLFEAAKAYGAKNWKYLIYVLFPLLLPGIITGSIVAWGEAWEAIIAAEIIVNVPGVGSYLANVGNSNHSELLIIGIALLLMILFIINKYLWLPLLNFSTEYQQD